MKLDLPSEVLNIIKKVTDKGFEVYIVGGAVRDTLMGRFVEDWDFTTNATPEAILSIFPEGKYENKFGTVMIPNDIVDTPFDITTFRTEKDYSDSRRPDKVEWGKTLEEDLKRRDFTINALALKIQNPIFNILSSGEPKVEVELIDYYDGQSDLTNKIIRAVGDPNERFSEDALRMMRAVRIASQLGFTIDQKTAQAIQTNCPLINNIAKERIKDELFKIFSSPFPYEGMLLFRNVGLMLEVLPEMEKTFGVEQKSPGRHHVYDVGTHSLLSLKYVSEKNNDPVVRFATFIHDIGKAQTVRKLESGIITFYNHEIIGGRIAKRIAERLRFSKEESERLYLLVRYHQFTVDEHQTDSALRRFIRKVGIENVPDMLDLRVGDRLGGGARETSWRLEEFKKRLIEVQKQPFAIKDLKITGHDVMQELDLKPGPKVGKILADIFKKVEDKKIDNEREQLLKLLNEYR